jgi:hypothetical protein
MDKIYSWALQYQAAISMILALFAFAFLAMCPVTANAAPLSDGMEFQVAKFKLVCGTPTIIHDALRADHGEVPMIAGNFDNGSSWVYYVNEDNTTATFVVHKSEDNACIIFAGESPQGEALVPNAQPNWPVKETADTQEWNS